MSIAIDIKFDVSDLERFTGRVLRQLKSGLRSAVDKSARAARNDTLQVLADDLNVPLVRIKIVLPLVKGSTQANLTATWPIGSNASMIRGPGMTQFPLGRLGSITGSTFTLSVGGSSVLRLNRAFAIRARNGGTALLIRLGPGRNNVKAIYAGRASTDMSQSDSVPRKVWTTSAEKNVTSLASAAVQRVFDGMNPDNLPTLLQVNAKDVA